MPSFFNRFSPLVGSVAVLFAAVPMASLAQDPPPAAPPMSPAEPVTPTAPPAPPVPAVAAPVLSVPPVNPAAPSADEMKRARDAYLQAVQAMNRARDAMNKQMGASGPTIRGFALSGPAMTYFNTLRGTSLPNQTISLNVKNTSARDALAKVLDEAKINYLIEDDFPKNAKLTLSIDGVQISTALDLITQSAGVQWVTEKRGNKIFVRAGKNVRASLPFSLNSLSSTLSYASPQALSNLDKAGGFSALAPLFGRHNGVPLPSATVSLDLKDAFVRDALVKLLDKQNLSYEISDDFPKDAKITISVQELQVSDILDRLTQSVGYQWVAEKRGGKTVIRVGKNVAPDAFRFYSETGTGARFDALKPLTVPGTNPLRIERESGNGPLIYQYRTSEERSTFTCPKCGKKTTIVQKADAKPGDANNKPHDAWHYCPYCGKKVADTGADYVAPLWQRDAAAPAASINAGFCKPYTITLVQGDLRSARADGSDGGGPHWKIDFTQ